MYARSNSTLVLAAMAATASLNVLAVPITGATVTGLSITYLPSPPGGACPAGNVCANASTDANVAAALSGPGNVELNKFGGTPVTTLSGTFGHGGPAITLSSLVLADWTANSNALARDYIADAWLSLFPTALSPAQLNSGAGIFITNNLWTLVSDPNVSYVDLSGGAINIGLDGLLDATSFLNPIALAFTGHPLPAGTVAQASEAVKVAFNGETDYLYGFHAGPTGYAALDGVSYTGDYAVSVPARSGPSSVPEPSTLWLLGIGLVGMVSRSRRRR